MHVLHLSTPKTWRGGEQQIAYLADELKQLGVEQTIVCPKDSPLYKWSYDHGIRIIGLAKSSNFDLPFAVSLAHITKHHPIDLVHLHDSSAHTLALLSTFFGNKKPMVLSRRVDFPIGKSFLSRWKYNHKRIRKIICVSDAIRNIMAASVNQAKLVTVHSGVDCFRFKPKNNKLREEFNIPNEVAVIGNIAAIAPHKDYYTFLKTVSILKSKNLRTKYFVIGDGPLREAITAEVKRLNLESDVIMTGFRNDVDVLLPSLDILLFTSETEGLGTTVLDAFCCGVPVVATKAGGVVELVDHEKTGLLANVKDASGLAENVQRLLSDSALKQTLIDNASQKVQGFSKFETAKKTMAVYKQILTGK